MTMTMKNATGQTIPKGSIIFSDGNGNVVGFVPPKVYDPLPDLMAYWRHNYPKPWRNKRTRFQANRFLKLVARGFELPRWSRESTDIIGDIERAMAFLGVARKADALLRRSQEEK